MPTAKREPGAHANRQTRGRLTFLFPSISFFICTSVPSPKPGYPNHVFVSVDEKKGDGGHGGRVHGLVRVPGIMGAYCFFSLRFISMPRAYKSKGCIVDLRSAFESVSHRCSLSLFLFFEQTLFHPVWVKKTLPTIWYLPHTRQKKGTASDER